MRFDMNFGKCYNKNKINPIKKEEPAQQMLHWPDYEKNDRKVLFPFDDITITKKCESHMM